MRGVRSGAGSGSRPGADFRVVVLVGEIAQERGDVAEVFSAAAAPLTAAATAQ